MSAVEKSLKSVARAREIALAIKDSKDPYKSALICRLEVQYSLSLLRNRFQIETAPPKIKRSKIGTGFIFGQIGEFLSECELLLKENKIEEAFAQLLSADLLLGRAIPIVRNESI